MQLGPRWQQRHGTATVPCWSNGPADPAWPHTGIQRLFYITGSQTGSKLSRKEEHVGQSVLHLWILPRFLSLSLWWTWLSPVWKGQINFKAIWIAVPNQLSLESKTILNWFQPELTELARGAELRSVRSQHCQQFRRCKSNEIDLNAEKLTENLTTDSIIMWVF